MFNKKLNLTFVEWLIEISKPKREYFQLVGGSSHHVEISKKEYERNIRIYIDQKRKEKSPIFIVHCPESNVKVLVQSNGMGKYKNQLGATWNFKK